MIATFALLCGAMVAQDGFTFKTYEADKIPASEFANRRKMLRAAMPAGNVTVLVTNPMHQRSNDTDFRFRPNSYFWYMSGCEESDSALALSNEGFTIDGRTVNEVLFVADKSPGAETWTGVRMGPEVAKQLLGIQAVVSNRRFAEVLKSATATSVTLVERPQGATGTVAKMLADYDQWAANIKADRTSITQINNMRSIKSAEEIRLTRKSIQATCSAHIEALKSAEPGMREYEIASLVEYIFAKNGCESVAYGSIVGSGVNSCVLHYVDARKPFNNGDIVCMDVGGEYHGYASDVTRSYPVNGKFSPEQKAIYELVQKAQEAGVQAYQAGAPFNASDAAARKIIGEGLVKLGIIAKPEEARRYFMHGTSHYVGLDVHDTGDYGPVRPGQLITVEPGVYIKEGSPCDKKWWNIGIRIEDTVLITANGPENLSGNILPRDIPKIEALMAQKGLGNRPEGKIAAMLFKNSAAENAHAH
ncbi:MAG TPA: aminopeptidase P family protein [Fimbriimonas sp.]|nr:aminopeptidase P family protein [Fimbriimonas sp.]